MGILLCHRDRYHPSRYHLQRIQHHVSKEWSNPFQIQLAKQEFPTGAIQSSLPHIQVFPQLSRFLHRSKTRNQQHIALSLSAERIREMIEEKPLPDPRIHRTYDSSSWTYVFPTALYIEIAVALLSESEYYTYITREKDYFHNNVNYIRFRDDNNQYTLTVCRIGEKDTSVGVYGARGSEIDPNQANQLLNDIEDRLRKIIKSNGSYNDAKFALWCSLGFLAFVLLCNWTRNPPPFFINIIILVICGALSIEAIYNTTSHNPGKSWLAILSAILVVVAFLLSIVGAVA